MKLDKVEKARRVAIARRAKWQSASHMLAKAVMVGEIKDGSDMLEVLAEDPVLDAASSPYHAQTARGMDGIKAVYSKEEDAGHRLTKALTCSGFAHDLMVARQAAAPGVIAALEALGQIIGYYHEDMAGGVPQKARRISDLTFMKASQMLLAFYRSTTPKITSTAFETSGGPKTVANMSDEELLAIAQGGHVPAELLEDTGQVEERNGPGRPRSQYT